MNDMWRILCHEQVRGFSSSAVFTSVEKALDYVHAVYMYSHYRGEKASCGLKKIRWQCYYENDPDRQIDGYYEDEQLQGIKQKYRLWTIEKLNIDPDWVEVASIEETLKWSASVGLPSRKDMFEFDETLPSYAIAGPTETNTYNYKYYTPIEVARNIQERTAKNIEEMVKSLIDGVKKE